MKNITKPILATIFYAAFTGLGFAIIYYVLHIDPTSNHMYRAGLILMMIMSLYVTWLLKKRDVPQGENLFSLKNLPGTLLALWIGVLLILKQVEALRTHGFLPDIMIIGLLSLFIGYCEEGMFRVYLLDYFQGKPLGPLLFGVLFSILGFGFLHMVNIAQGFTPYDAWIQSIYAIPVGITFTLIYLATKNFPLLALWHAYIDYTLFMAQYEPFPLAMKLGETLPLVQKGFVIYAIGLLLYKIGQKSTP